MVEGHTYINTSVGLEFTTADQLALGTPELKGPQGAAPAIVKVFALGEAKPASTTESTVFYAEDLRYSPPSQRTTEGYLRWCVAANQQEGFQHVKGEKEGKIGNVAFGRLDFQKGEGGGHEAVFVLLHKGVALVFLFTGSDLEAVNKIVASTKLKLQP
ncbi:MAG: hypothetical protein DMG76_17015 [Acidobacteria bacterium]|nr:MAG: hypothetical protein DMG76_17015 [Acidobacteriota bacterium]